MDELEGQISDAFREQNSRRVIDLLRKRPSLAALTNRLNQDVFWLACSYGMIDVVRLLMEPDFRRFVNIHRLDQARRDAYDIAESYSHEDVLEFLDPIYGVADYPAIDKAPVPTFGEALLEFKDNALSTGRDLGAWVRAISFGSMPRAAIVAASVIALLVPAAAFFFLSTSAYLSGDDDGVDIRRLVANGSDDAVIEALAELLPVSSSGFSKDPLRDTAFVTSLRSEGWEFSIRREVEFSYTKPDDNNSLKTNIQCSLRFSRDSGETFQSALQVFDIYSEAYEVRRSGKLVPSPLGKYKIDILEYAILYCFRI